jgi:hypothetical protein
VKLFGLSAFSASFSGPGSLALALCSPIRTLCGCCALACCPAAKAAPATASVVVPRSRRREKIPPEPAQSVRQAGKLIVRHENSPLLIP